MKILMPMCVGGWRGVCLFVCLQTCVCVCTNTDKTYAQMFVWINEKLTKEKVLIHSGTQTLDLYNNKCILNTDTIMILGFKLLNICMHTYVCVCVCVHACACTCMHVHMGRWVSCCQSQNCMQTDLALALLQKGITVCI